ncbi:ABC transporter substrate-binding protein [Patulibacter sp. NPDC049589]|uniref:ABC transporter substrate-binding protein n=1 Tax=Patulibacter sp. NPDC049589 TaxID=3154731 RepID=UPI003422472F
MTRPFSSTRSRAAVLAVSALALGLNACGSDSSSDSSSSGSSSNASASTGKPVSGGTLRFAINSDSNCLDPHQSPADVAGFFSRPILDSLVALDVDGKLSPWLATKWSVSKDQKTYSFTLRDDVKFSNGETFDGAAVKANLDHIVDPKTKSQLAANTIATYSGTTVVDATHVKVHFKSPNSAFLPSAASAYLGIEAPSTLKQAPEKLCSKVVGSGPFVSKDGYVPQKGIEYVKNPAYAWGPGNAKHQGAAYLDRLSVSVIPEDSSRYGALTSNQIDAIASVPPVNVKALKGTPGFAVDTASAPGGNYSYYPNTQSGPFKDIRVREAFRAGIDWKTIVDKLYFGVFPAANGPLGPTTVGYDGSSAAAYAFDKAKAEKLLDEAGWTGRDSAGYRTKDGKRLTLLHPYLKAYVREQRDVLGDQIQAAAKELGIEVVNKNTTLDAYLKQLGDGTADLGDLSWQRSSPDALRTLFGTENIAPKGGFGTNQARYSNPKLDALLKQGLAETDLAQQKATYAQAQQLIAKDAATFPVYVFDYVLGRSDKVQGITFEPQAYPTFYDAWIGS